ncbi:hypothetical protein OHQ88_03995 [Micromonospora zamorensis]|uniref:SWIM-type domain-containing protein n=1 Tax=Micromonospora zamorensis TaxID=709883 RepID=A0ABZ1PHS1_9ACTN
MTITGRTPDGEIRLLLATDDNGSQAQIARLYHVRARLRRIPAYLQRIGTMSVHCLGGATSHPDRHSWRLAVDCSCDYRLGGNLPVHCRHILC